jgi:hypothetical protein
MTERYRLESGQHPAIGTILLHMDGELDAPTSAAIAQHFSVCWECRVQSDKIRRGIDAFMEYRQDVLIASVPPPSSRQHLFRLQSREILGGAGINSPLALLRRFASAISAGPRMATGITAILSAAILIFLVAVPVAHPTRLTAAELIQRARASAWNSAVPRPASSAQPEERVIYQEVQFRVGKRTIEREIVLTGTDAAAAAEPPDAEWARVLASTPIDWRDPLGVERYEIWREHEGKGQVTVSEAGGFATLHDVPLGKSPVVSASLTVRELDWHPIAKQVNFADRDSIEVREIDYGIRTVPPRDSAPPSAGPAVRIPPLSPEPAGGGTPNARVDLDEAEVRFREVLHDAGADLDEAPEMIRDSSMVRLRAPAGTPGGLLAALRAIPNTVVEAFDPPAGSNPGTPAGFRQTPDIPMYSTVPPLFKALQDFVGGVDSANTYLHGVRDSYGDALVAASALQRLADRYSGAEWERLQPALRTRIDRIADDYTDSLRQRSDIYLRQLSRVLDEMLNRSGLTAAGTGESAPPCRSWRIGSSSGINELRRLETAFQRLFVVEKTAQPISLSGEALLLESADLRARYAQSIGHFCVAGDVAK